MTNRTEHIMVVSKDGKKFSITTAGGKTYTASSPLELDKKMDASEEPRPRIFRAQKA